MSWIKGGAALCAAGIALAALGAWQSRRLPTAADFLPASATEPRQAEPRLRPFTVERAGHTYAIDPIHSYELSGLVVTAHDSDSFFDISHKDWNDYLNTKDICVVWGGNLDRRFLPKMEFWSGNWTCYFRTGDAEAWRNFKPNQISNNHVLPADEAIAELLRGIRVGDEIRLKGHLVNYSIDGGHPRKSSVVREDTGNGACEILYVEEAHVLASHNHRWARARAGGGGLAAAGFLAFAFGAFVLPFLKPGGASPPKAAPSAPGEVSRPVSGGGGWPTSAERAHRRPHRKSRR